MIEVSARMTRGSVYLAGEVVECILTFQNPLGPARLKSQSNRDVCEALAWASAQIHCLCTVNDDRVVYPSRTRMSHEEICSNHNTSFTPCVGERGHVVLATKPKILFCDVRLLPGESQNFKYSEVLPSEAPPSYRGYSVKYSYKITVGMQRFGSTIRLLRVPIRVLIVTGFLDNSLTYMDNGDLGPSNPFLQHRDTNSGPEATLQLLQMVTARKTPNFYNVTNSHGKVVRFCLFKSAFKLGEDIVGTFDFSDSTVKCIQYSVTLQSEEVVSEEIRRKPQHGSSVVSYCKCHEVCLSLEHTQMILPIPFSVTPAFATDLVTLDWRLHFEFVTTTTAIGAQPVGQVDLMQASNWKAPVNLDIETMVWDLPVTIHPTSSKQLMHCHQSNHIISICI